MEVEEWRPVVGYEDQYEVSSLGEVRSLPRVIEVVGNPRFDHRTIRGQILKQWRGSHGYFCVGLGRNNVLLVHRLVCTAFHGPCPPGMEVCHGPNGKWDNRASQLRWGTRSENHGVDRERDGMKIRGEQHHAARLNSDMVRAIRSYRGMESSPQTAARFGVSPRSVRDVWNKVTWSHVPD